MPALLAGNALRAHSQEGPPEHYLIWIGQRCWPSPYVLAQTVGSLDRCLFIDPPNAKQALWATDYALRSAAVAAVIVDCTDSSTKNPKVVTAITRRLALAARTGGALGLLIRDSQDFAQPTVATSRWVVAPHLPPQDRSERVYAEQSQAEQSQAEQSQAEQSQAEQSQALCFDLELLRYKGQAPAVTQWCIELSDVAIPGKIPRTIPGDTHEYTAIPFSAASFSIPALRLRIFPAVSDRFGAALEHEALSA